MEGITGTVLECDCGFERSDQSAEIVMAIVTTKITVIMITATIMTRIMIAAMIIIMMGVTTTMTVNIINNNNGHNSGTSLRFRYHE